MTADVITLTGTISWEALQEQLRSTVCRGLYHADGSRVQPYKDAEFILATVHPRDGIGGAPKITFDDVEGEVFTPQPTIYQNQTDTLKEVDEFLTAQGHDITQLDGAVSYHWEGRGDFHILPPVIEDHEYYLENGYFDMDKLCQRLDDIYVKDAKGNMHHLADGVLRKFYLDEISHIDYISIFNSNIPLANYGLSHTGEYHFNIVCDGAHRVDYAIEHLQKSVQVILVKPKPGQSLLPYYALPVPFTPYIRLSSKTAEKIHYRIERDKIHLLNDYIKKVMHYDWADGGLRVSKLRSNVDIH